MFNDLPTKIKKMIFARVRHMDLFEVCVVSQEWWTLTMATCSTTSKKYFYFFNFQVTFCNEMMPKAQGWEKWMFIEFTDDKTIELFAHPDKKVIKYLRQKRIHVRKLVYFGDDSLVSNVKKVFPQLQTLVFYPEFSYDHYGKPIVLPVGLKHLRLKVFEGDPWSDALDVFKHLERVDSLCIRNGQRFLLDNISFEKLKCLNLDMSEQSTEDIMSLVTGSKQLSVVSLENGLIDKQWLGLFPTNIKKLHLEDMRLDPAIVPLLGTANAFVERQLMRFVCQDWTKLSLFKSSNWCNDNYYFHTYSCRPQVLEEELHITMNKEEIPSGLLDTGKLQLRVLKCNKMWRTIGDFDLIVPKSVKHFEWEADLVKAIDFAAMFHDISTMTTLRINCRLNEKIQFSYFPQAANLVSLDICMIHDDLLESILRNCPYLEQLTLKWPQGMPFVKLRADLITMSVKQLTIIKPEDAFIHILAHFPCLVDLHLQCGNMETVTIGDLTQLANVEFVRISFQNDTNLTAFSLVVNCLHSLPFAHIMLGYSSFKTHERLSCIMGREKSFFRRYLNCKNDFSKMNIQDLFHCFPWARLWYFKGVPSTHLSGETFRITHDLQEFIEEALVEFQLEKNNDVLE